MKAGRPSHRVKGCWITVERDDGIAFFELDKKGNLVKQNGRIVEHHVSLFNRNKITEVALPLPLPMPFVTEENISDYHQASTVTNDSGYSPNEADYLFDATNFYEEGIDNCFDYSSISYDIF